MLRLSLVVVATLALFTTAPAPAHACAAAAHIPPAHAAAARVDYVVMEPEVIVAQLPTGPARLFPVMTLHRLRAVEFPQPLRPASLRVMTLR